MTQIAHATACLTRFLGEIRDLKGSEFPYVNSAEALTILEDLVVKNLDRVSKLGSTASPGVVRQECTLALSVIWQYLPIVGFLLRSTNVRNAFEVYGPTLRLARQLLEPTVAKGSHRTKLILSSEWSYSPFIYKEFVDLSDFVLIGLPAHESGNPLLIPLAGHELGHRVWAKKKFNHVFQKEVITKIIDKIKAKWPQYTAAFPLIKITQSELTTNLYALESYNKAVAWSLKQMEETYCDFMGLRLFGPSYLHAFSYILAPATPGGRVVFYPNFRARIDNLIEAANHFSVKVPPAYKDRFQDLPLPKLSAGDAFQSELADEVLREFIPKLITLCADDVANAAIPFTSLPEEQRIVDRFRFAVPAENVTHWINILNAAWYVNEETTFWNNNSTLNNQKERVLKDLVLKNIELYEIAQILNET